MDHRYGRHGPQAWLRWYHRHHFTQSSTTALLIVPVAHYLVVVYEVSLYPERVVTIMDAEQQNLLSSPSRDEDIKNKGAWQAHEDLHSADQYCQRQGADTYIIHPTRIQQRAKDLAYQTVKSLYNGNAPRVEDGMRLEEVYLKGYLGQIAEEGKDKTKVVEWPPADFLSIRF